MVTRSAVQPLDVLKIRAQLGIGERRMHAHVATLATREGRGLTFMAHEVSYYKGVAKGVKAITLDKGDSVLDFTLVTSEYDGLEVETNRGARQTISTAKYGVTGRGGKGRELLRRGQFTRVIPPPITVPTLGS